MRVLSLLLATILVFGVQAVSAQNVQSGLEKPTPAVDVGGMASADRLRQDMRKLWSDHVFWTRDYAAAAIANQPDQDAAAKRLLKNQEDIGNAMAQYYGREAGDKVTALLKDHILIAIDLIKAAKNHDDNKFSEADRRWDRNGEDIATFLSSANPFWSKAALTDMMRMHLSTTKNEVTARLNKDWEGDVRAFDAVYDHILKMSDALSDGIIKQFPERFSPATGDLSSLDDDC
jgi:hypothetical protein